MWPFSRRTGGGRSDRRVDNAWTGGEVNLVFPPLRSDQVGTNGVRLLPARFRPDVGDEYYLQILETPEWAPRYGAIRVLSLYGSTLVVATDAGPVAVVLWRLAEGAKTHVTYEHFMDPCVTATLEMLRRAGRQSRLKVVLRDNLTGETQGFWEVDNNFELGEFAGLLEQACAGVVAGDMDHRVALVRQDYPLEQLLALSGHR